MNSRKWVLALALAVGAAFPAPASAGCGWLSPWDCTAKDIGNGLKKVGDALQNFADAPAKLMTNAGFPPIVANTLTYINPVNAVTKLAGMGASTLGNYLDPKTVTVKSSGGCDSSIACCVPLGPTKNPPSPLQPVNKVLDKSKVTYIDPKTGKKVTVTKDGTATTTSGKNLTVTYPGDGGWIGKDGTVIGGKKGGIGTTGGGILGPDSSGGTTGDSGAAYTPPKAAPGGGVYASPIGHAGGGNAGVSGIGGAGDYKGVAVQGAGVMAQAPNRTPVGSAGAQRAAGTPPPAPGTSAPGQGSASVALNAKFAGDGSFVGGGQGIAGGLGVAAGAGASIQKGGVSNIETTVPEIPVEGVGEKGDGKGKDSVSGLGGAKLEGGGEAPGAPEGQEEPLSKTVGLMRDQSGFSKEIGGLVESALRMIEMRDWESAIKTLNRAIELDGDNPLLYVYRATAYSLNGDYKSAEADARKAIELDPKSSPAHEALAWALLRQERYQESVEAATKAIELDPQSAMPWAIRAYAKQMLGDMTGMLADIQQAAALDPRFKPQAAAALKGGRIYDPSIADALYILGPGAKRGARGGSAGGLLLGFLLLLLGSMGAGAVVFYRRRARKAAAEGKKLDLDFLLKGMERKPAVKR